MAKGKNEKLPKRKDGRKRTKRQEQTLLNNRNFRARKFYDEVRPKWRKELQELRKVVRELRYGIADITRRHQAKSEEHQKELKRLRKDNGDFAKLYFDLQEEHKKLLAQFKELEVRYQNLIDDVHKVHS